MATDAEGAHGVMRDYLGRQGCWGRGGGGGAALGGGLHGPEAAESLFLTKRSGTIAFPSVAASSWWGK